VGVIEMLGVSEMEVVEFSDAVGECDRLGEDVRESVGDVEDDFEELGEIDAEIEFVCVNDGDIERLELNEWEGVHVAVW
jgi:hypothetical protein